MATYFPVRTFKFKALIDLFRSIGVSGFSSTRVVKRVTAWGQMNILEGNMLWFTYRTKSTETLEFVFVFQ